jgi:hypothetical protein
MIEALCEAAHFDISRSEKLHIADAAQCHERTGAAVYSWMKTFLMQEQVFVKGIFQSKWEVMKGRSEEYGLKRSGTIPSCAHRVIENEPRYVIFANFIGITCNILLLTLFLDLIIKN